MEIFFNLVQRKTYNQNGFHNQYFWQLTLLANVSSYHHWAANVKNFDSNEMYKHSFQLIDLFQVWSSKLYMFSKLKYMMRITNAYFHTDV